MGKWEKQETHSAHTVFVFADNVARIPQSAFRIGYAVHVVRFRNPKPQSEPIPPFAGYPLPNPLDKPLLWTWRGVWPLLILTQHLTWPALGQAILESSRDQTQDPPPATTHWELQWGDTCATLDSSHCRRLIGAARVQLLDKMQLT